MDLVQLDRNPRSFGVDIDSVVAFSSPMAVDCAPNENTLFLFGEKKKRREKIGISLKMLFSTEKCDFFFKKKPFQAEECDYPIQSRVSLL